MSRYEGLIRSGALLPDDRQHSVVARLACLLDDLGAYSGGMQEYQRQLEEHKSRRRQRLQELEEEDEEVLRRENEKHQHHHQQQQQQGQQQQPAAGGGGGGSGVLPWLRGLFGVAPGPPAPPDPSPTAQQRVHLMAQRRRSRVAAELGPGPAPPPAPKGVYVHGSVGSGKSALMDMFFEAATRGMAGRMEGGRAPGNDGSNGGGGGGDEGGPPRLEFARRMHFNAAMLEIHSRLHLLDVRREAREHGHHHHNHQRAADRPATGGHEPPAAAAGEGGARAAAAAAAGGGRVAAALLDEALELGEELEAGGGAARGTGAGMGDGASGGGGGGDGDGASDWQVGRWFDPESAKQKQAKAAVLAVRRHLRETRAGRVPRERLAAANAAVMRAAARSFIRATGADPASGWTHGRGHAAALLCFDELQVTDVWSAVALKALFEALTAEGCVVVLTSNRAPHELPRHGLHEAMWEHFIDRLMTSCQVVELSAANDYRRLTLDGPAAQRLQLPVGHGGEPPAASPEPPAASASVTGPAAPAETVVGLSEAKPRSRGSEEVQVSSGGAGPQRLYFWPLGPASDSEMERIWRALASPRPSEAAAAGWAMSDAPGAVGEGGRVGSAGGGDTCSSSINGGGSEGSYPTVPVLFGRQLPVPRAAGGAAWFQFADLCAKPLGPADYMALSHSFHTVFVSGVPAMSMQVRDQARRFITLIDELYNARTLLVLSAAAAPDGLFSGAGDEPILDLEGLQFETAVEGSRLRRDLLGEGGVAPVASTEAGARAAAAALGGAEERFAFARAVSRLYEMQSALYVGARPRGAWAQR